MEKLKKWSMVALASMAVMLVSIVNVFAESETANAALVSAATNTANAVIANINGVLPIALGVMGVALAIAIGVRFFKKTTKSSAS